MKIAFLDSNILISMSKCNKEQKITPSFEKDFQFIKSYSEQGYLFSTTGLIIESNGQQDGSVQERLDHFELKTKDILEKFKKKFLPNMKFDLKQTEKALEQEGADHGMIPKHWKNFLIEVQPLLKESVKGNECFPLCKKIIEIAKKHTEYEQYKINDGFYTTSLIIITILCLLTACKNPEILKNNIFKFTQQGDYNPCNPLYDISVFYFMIWTQQTPDIKEVELITNDKGLKNVLELFDYPNNMKLDKSIKNLMLSAAKHKVLNFENFNNLDQDQYNLILEEISHLDSPPPPSSN